MTKIVYVDPNISPEVWTAPRGVVALPISEHPAIVAEQTIERLPKEYKPRPLSERTKSLVDYLIARPPTDANTIAADLGLRWESVKSLLLANPQLFRRAGTVQVKKVNRALWTVGAQNK